MTAAPVDVESSAWIEALGAEGGARPDALARLHELLLRAARFEGRRRGSGLSAGDLEDLAQQAAGDALVAVLAKLGDFRGESRFTTWAYKFALLEMGVRLRRRAWQGRELPLEGRAEIADLRPSPEAGAESAELLAAISEAVTSELTPRQREVLVAVALRGVPIDVLAERRGTTRGALYKTLHDARRRLRARLAEQGLSIGDEP